MRLFQIDAFTDRVFGGNPAAVVPLERWPDDGLMRSIAMENNLAETAFLVPAGSGIMGGGGDYEIRWFTPTVEVELCGHATLASAHALWAHLGHAGDRLELDSHYSGRLTVRHSEEGRYTLDFPRIPAEPVEMSDPTVEAVIRALGTAPEAMLRSKWDYMAVYANKRDVHGLTPDGRALRAIEARGVIATAPGASHDFVSRFFGPRSGVDEDHATGSAHCTLAPYWAERLGRSSVVGHQVSPRGAEIACAIAGDRVELTGGAVTYLAGEIVGS